MEGECSSRCSGREGKRSGAGDPVVDEAVAVVVFFVASLGRGDDLAEADRFVVFARSQSSAALAPSKGSRSAFVARIGRDVVDKAIAVGVFAVANFDGVGIACGVVVVAIAVVGKAVFVGILEGAAGAVLAKLAFGAIGVAAFLADAVNANFAVGAFRSADAFAQAVVADIAELRARRIAFDAKNTASTEASVSLGTGRLTTFDGDATTELFITKEPGLARCSASDGVAVWITIYALTVEATLIGGAIGVADDCG